MTDPQQIPFLIKLLDDESPDIQDRVFKELVSFGPTLKKELKNINFPLSNNQKEFVDLIFQNQKRNTLYRKWPAWVKLLYTAQNEKAELECLEEILGLLADYLNPHEGERYLKGYLNKLAEEFTQKYLRGDARLLARFLFQDKGLRGNEKDYYNPQNSNLTNVILSKKGIPLSLTTIYMLVGSRLNIPIQGCHFPGHFLARIDLHGKRAFVDCFNGGRIIGEENIIRVREDILNNIEQILQEKASPESLLRRYLANLIRAFQIQENEEEGEFMIDLFRELDYQVIDQNISDLTPDDIIHKIVPQFTLGQRVKHMRYGYRGVIVEIDEECQASDEWYYANQTQPHRNQPWYHVLVHGSDQITYVAENNLLEDKTKENIVHPWLSYFFNQSQDGKYIRNENPWPESQESEE